MDRKINTEGRRKATNLIQKAATNIKKYRMKAGLTQEQLEEKTRIGISRCETGKFDMTLTTLCILGESLKVEPHEFLK